MASRASVIPHTATNGFHSSSRLSATYKDLRVNVRMLGNSLGSIVKSTDPEVFDAVEKLRLQARAWRNEEASTGQQFDEMVQDIASYDTTKLKGVARAFTHFLALSNSAENHHRVRRLRNRMMKSESALVADGTSAAASMKLLTTGPLKIPKEQVFQALLDQKVEIVLTAHPTEVNRRTMLDKHNRLREALDALDSDKNTATPYEVRELYKAVDAEIASIWETDDLRRSKPSPVEEAVSGLAVVEKVMWHAVPSYVRKLDDVSREFLDKPLPLDAAPITVASWMGGDRDGNPNVTPEITREVSMISRQTAARLFKQDISQLKMELSLITCSPELRALTEGEREPYRAILSQLESRLDATKAWCKAQRSLIVSNSIQDEAKAIMDAKELVEPLLLLHRSLCETGNSVIAEGRLTDTIRRLAAFGMALAPLDIRQESTRHSEALDAITRHLKLGSYLEWDEDKRREWICQELATNRPLLPKHCDFDKMGFSSTVKDTLLTYKLIAELGTRSLGAYVISQCQEASDVLAVALLQMDAGVQEPMRVVPLFETLDDLERSSATVEALFTTPVYVDYIKGKQEIMVGYSDSAKDAGRLAASWAQYKCQVEMDAIAKATGVEVTFFHGKGGTVGRGGNPALYKAILAHPPNTINGRFRVTEQGEMITQNFGQREIAERTLDLFTAGVLTERFIDRPEPKKEWVEAMERISESSCKAYRAVVREEPDFVPYFRSATPELELSGLNVGSRPAKRNPKGGVESLRAIPWVFAWTQTRLNLPAWLGVGVAVKAEQQNPEWSKNLSQMYSEWPWFQTLVDLLEMILVKSDAQVAANYDRVLVKDENCLRLGRELRERMKISEDAVLTISKNTTLQSNNEQLLRSLHVRNPYIDPLNIIQAELLKRARVGEGKMDEESRRELSDALLITINGVANGMRNSG
jgi:phosphoenolpyruvate carboxylase